jgi:hypothetical protein
MCQINDFFLDLWNNMAIFSNIFEKIKTFISISWTYLCVLWFILVIILIYILKGPLKLTENVSTGSLLFILIFYCCFV